MQRSTTTPITGKPARVPEAHPVQTFVHRRPIADFLISSVQTARGRGGTNQSLDAAVKLGSSHSGTTQPQNPAVKAASVNGASERNSAY